MVKPKCVTDPQVVGLETVHLRNLMIIYPELAQGDLGQQGQHDRGPWSCCRPCVPWDLLRLAPQVEADLPLEEAVDQQPDDREHKACHDLLYISGDFRRLYPVGTA